jgi:hypothetical protein
MVPSVSRRIVLALGKISQHITSWVSTLYLLIGLTAGTKQHLQALLTPNNHRVIAMLTSCKGSELLETVLDAYYSKRKVSIRLLPLDYKPVTTS